MTKHNYEVFGKRIHLDLDWVNTDIIRDLEASINDAIGDAYRKDPTARVTSVKLDAGGYDCYVSVEVTP